MSTPAGNTFNEWLTEQSKDEDFRAEYDRLQPAFDVARLRMERGLTQAELAHLVGTRQSSISRLESGKTEPSLSFLRRVVEALGGRLEIVIAAAEEAVATEQAHPAGVHSPASGAAGAPSYVGAHPSRENPTIDKRVPA